MPGFGKRIGLQYQPIITGPSPQAPEQAPKKTPELHFHAYDPTNPKHKKNNPQSSSKEVQNLATLPAPTDMAPGLLTFDATAAPVPQQLSYHFYSSFRPASHEHSPARESTDSATRQTVPEETVAEDTRVPRANKTGTTQVLEPVPVPTAKASDVGRHPNLKKDLTPKQQEHQNLKEREELNALKKRLRKLEPPQVTSKKAKVTPSDGCFTLTTNLTVSDDSWKRTRIPYNSTEIPDAQAAPRNGRTSVSNQLMRLFDDDTDDEEEKPPMPTKKPDPQTIDRPARKPRTVHLPPKEVQEQRLRDIHTIQERAAQQEKREEIGYQATLKGPDRSMLEGTFSVIDSIIAAWGAKNVDSIPGEVRKGGSLPDVISKWVKHSSAPSFHTARSWVNYATYLRLRYGGGSVTQQAIGADWNEGRRIMDRHSYRAAIEGVGLHDPPFVEGDLKGLGLKIDEDTGFIKADPSQKPSPKTKGTGKRKKEPEAGCKQK